MPLATASGVPQLAGVASPEIWSPKLRAKFYDQTFLSQIANTDYEGEIKKKGSKVHVRTTPDVTVHRGYKKGQTLTHEHLTPTDVELEIDQGDWWDFIIDDVDRFQADYDFMEDWTRDAAEQIKLTAESTVLEGIYADPDSTMEGITAGADSGDIDLGAAGDPRQFTADAAIDIITDCHVCMAENSVPESDPWWFLLPPWATKKIKTSDVKDASMMGDGTSVLRNGRIGILDGAEVFATNRLKKVTDSSGSAAWYCLFGHKKALTFAAQVVENQVLNQVESTFGAVCRGLHVYGYKVLLSTAIGCLYIKK